MSLLFCPNCANILIIGDESGLNKWVCQTCPYQFPIVKQHTYRTRIQTKTTDAVQDVLEDLSRMPKTPADCEVCNHGFAYFMQLQIRSADEPMTTFYKCASCGHVRREN